MTDRYAVVGHPIAHSKSPRIHRLFAEQTGQDLSYEAILAPLEGFAETVRRFQAEGGKGLNVTVPFKQEAWALAEERSAAAERAGAVNTLSLGGDGRIRGDNTDGVGLVRDLTRNHGLTLSGRRLLILGAGGAARGVLQPLLQAEPAEVFIANRTAEKAEALAAEFADERIPLAGGGFEALAGRRFDLIINATAAGLAGELPPLPGSCLAEGAWCYDMLYGPEPTAFVRWARAQGAAGAVDGLGMLVEQAAESFFIWRGVRPRTGPVIEALRRDAAD